MRAKHPDQDEMHRVYDDCRQGRESPGCILISGAAMNVLFECDTFEPNELYIVTPQGITLVEPATVH